eukprot:jgi/Hompol1/6317/HPOL_001076-RA
MESAQVPVVPGYHGENQDPDFLKSEANKMGYPVLIKAVKGGGGKEFHLMLESAKRESIKSFGDDKVLVEKYITRPRHVEVQVFADKHGNAVYLFERDCSVQRRHQKIIEEAPAPGLSPELRRSLGEKAVAAAKAVNYEGAGTVEFILDCDTDKFYFMEMNTRLQVEHPVTEMVTGTDLVEWQLRVAAGHPLPRMQSELRLNGHAFEARIYAENPDKGFLPDAGRLIHMRIPDASPSVRIETGVSEGDEVSVNYDPMISKLVVHAEDRTEALRVLRKSLGEFEVVGPSTNIEFIKKLASHPAFIAADLDTGFIKRHEAELFKPKGPVDSLVHAQAALFLTVREQSAHAKASASSSTEPQSPWSQISSLRLNSIKTKEFVFFETEDKDPKHAVKVTVEHLRHGGYTVKVRNSAGSEQVFENAELDKAAAALQTLDPASLYAHIGQQRIQSRVVKVDDEVLHIFFNGNKHVLFMPVPAYLQTEAHGAGHGTVVTPMPCKISQVLVKPGDIVKAGQPLFILEAMKMEHVIKSPKDASVHQVLYKTGDLVGDGKRLLTFVEE